MPVGLRFPLVHKLWAAPPPPQRGLQLDEPMLNVNGGYGPVGFALKMLELLMDSYPWVLLVLGEASAG